MFGVALALDGYFADVAALLSKYADRPISLADACLIRCAEIYDELRILTFDADFNVYRWQRTRRFRVLD